MNALPGPTDAEVADELDQVHRCVWRLLRRRRWWPEEDSSPSDPVAELVINLKTAKTLGSQSHRRCSFKRIK